MTGILGGLLVIVALASLLVFMVRGGEGVRRMFGGLLSNRNERWAGGLPANVLLIITTVMLALELGVVTGGAGSGLAATLIIGAAIAIALVPDIAALVLGILGLAWAVPRMVEDHGTGVVLPVLALSVLAAALAGFLRRG
jgi:hypothetical protein